jgi:hypothetical protein
MFVQWREDVSNVNVKYSKSHDFSDLLSVCDSASSDKRIDYCQLLNQSSEYFSDHPVEDFDLQTTWRGATRKP